MLKIWQDCKGSHCDLLPSLILQGIVTPPSSDATGYENVVTTATFPFEWAVTTLLLATLN